MHLEFTSPVECARKCVRTSAIVIGISLFVAVYLGFFDYIFTTGLSRILPFLPQRTPAAIVEPAATSSGSVQDITVETEPLRMDTADTE